MNGPVLIRTAEAGPGRQGIGTAPDPFVRWVFYLSIFAIPFSSLYVPGTGDRFGVVRLIQVLVAIAVCLQPAACIRRLPIALVFLGSYVALRVCLGLLLVADLKVPWSNDVLAEIEKLLWAWFMFNVALDHKAARGGLLALLLGSGVTLIFTHRKGCFANSFCVRSKC